MNDPKNEPRGRCCLLCTARVSGWLSQRPQPWSGSPSEGPWVSPGAAVTLGENPRPSSRDTGLRAEPAPPGAARSLMPLLAPPAVTLRILQGVVSQGPQDDACRAGVAREHPFLGGCGDGGARALRVPSRLCSDGTRGRSLKVLGSEESYPISWSPRPVDPAHTARTCLGVVINGPTGLGG